MKSMEIETMGVQRSVMVQRDHEGDDEDYLLEHKHCKI